MSWGDLCIRAFALLQYHLSFAQHRFPPLLQYYKAKRCKLGLQLMIIFIFIFIHSLFVQWSKTHRFSCYSYTRQRKLENIHIWEASVLYITWCCRGHSRPWRSSAACCLWWHHGSWLLSHWQRRGPASIWSPTWMGPGRGRNLGTYYTPAEGHSMSAAGRCSLCNPAQMTSSFAYFVMQWLGLWESMPAMEHQSSVLVL